MTDRPIRTQPNPKWIRGQFRGLPVVDSRNAVFVWEHPYYPAWYFPANDIAGELVATGEVKASSTRGPGVLFDIVVGDTTLSNAAIQYREATDTELAELIRVDFASLTNWYEEDEEVFVHPRSPHVRVDALASSRHVRVSIDGVEVASSSKPTLLFETGLPTRYYLPQTDVMMELLEPSSTESECPYKGCARYWSVRIADTVREDVVWGYRSPFREVQPIAGLVSFFNEHVDIEVDGVAIDRPQPLGIKDNAFEYRPATD